MNRLWKSLTISFFVLVCTACLLIGHAAHGDNLAGLSAWQNDHLKNFPTKSERGMVGGLPINGEVRTKQLLVGLWGGEHISMEVTKLRATIEYDCARGTIGQGITLDRQGRFNVLGMHIAEHGGPVREGEQSTGIPVRFAGQVNGKNMKLGVSNAATREMLGDFTLVYGAQPRLRKCK